MGRDGVHRMPDWDIGTAFFDMSSRGGLIAARHFRRVLISFSPLSVPRTIFIDGMMFL